GIGRATAVELARRGARVGVLSRVAGSVAETVAAIEAEGGVAMPLVADVTREAELGRAVGALDGAWGRLDLVVANAGANGVWAALDALTVAEWEQTLRTNLTGTFLTLRAALPLLRRRGGAVVVTSSVNGTRNFSNTGATAYATSKAAQVARLISFLLTADADHITGSELWIDGGESLLIG
nr:SDR family oxidoreductase [Chloroflexia bacterium]